MQGTKTFCSGGDQALRRKDGYADFESFGRLNASVGALSIYRILLLFYIGANSPSTKTSNCNGYAVGGGHILHIIWDLTIAADNAIFGQTGPKVGSFDAGYASSIMSHLVLMLSDFDVQGADSKNIFYLREINDH
ncbi:1,4-dihydroxy-2-naphthoyl-CoA synthase, peroxisomal [Capsicum annuum]|nr:1,4-dihydroxy-2-naphthoyl-CoA synthase, peroxisomal [Capsicum annuum]